MVDELRAVIRVDPAQPEGQRLAQLFQRLLHMALALTHHGARLHPGRVDVRQIQRVNELPIRSIARVRHEIDLGVAGHCDIPAVRLQRNLMLEQRPGLRAPILPATNLPLMLSQAAIHLPRAHRSKFLHHLARELPAPRRPG